MRKRLCQVEDMDASLPSRNGGLRVVRSWSVPATNANEWGPVGGPGERDLRSRWQCDRVGRQAFQESCLSYRFSQACSFRRFFPEKSKEEAFRGNGSIILLSSGMMSAFDWSFLQRRINDRKQTFGLRQGAIFLSKGLATHSSPAFLPSFCFSWLAKGSLLGS